MVRSVTNFWMRIYSRRRRGGKMHHSPPKRCRQLARNRSSSEPWPSSKGIRIIRVGIADGVSQLRERLRVHLDALALQQDFGAYERLAANETVNSVQLLETRRVVLEIAVAH